MIEEMNLLIRADADSHIGTGHVMRCLALAHAWQAVGGRTRFALTSIPARLMTLLEVQEMDIEQLTINPGSKMDAVQTVKLAERLSASWIAVDGYHFDTDYQQIVKEAGFSTLLIDDYGHARAYSADIVLNQNLHACEAMYMQRESYTRLLLGTRYALLRREFWTWHGWQRRIPLRAQHLLLTLGGSDPDNTTLTAIQALKLLKLPDLKVRVIVGPANSRLQELKEASENSTAQIEIITGVKDMPKLMAWADLVITAAGSTCWELAFMGVPMITVILANNQEPIAASLAEQGAALNAGWHNMLDDVNLADKVLLLLNEPEKRRQLSQHSRELVDSYGSRRVIDSLLAVTV